MDDGVNVLDVDAFGDIEADRGVIEDGLDTGLDQTVSDGLRFRAGDGDHGDLDAGLLDGGLQRSAVLDDEGANWDADLFVVIFENHGDIKATVCEALLAGYRGADITRTDHSHFPYPVYF